MSKNLIDEYITTLSIIRGFLISLLASAFIYLDYFNLSNRLLESILAILFLYLLLKSNDNRVWFWSGVFIALFWFWWISISFKYYGFPWAIPIGVFFISLTYGILFLIFSYISNKFNLLYQQLIFKSIFILTASYIHPFGFDWFRFELIFVNSYFGVEKWQEAIILLSLSLVIYKSKPIFLLLILFAYQPLVKKDINTDFIEVTNTNITIEDKWNRDFLDAQIYLVEDKINQAIKENKRIIIFPESVLPLYLNLNNFLMDILKDKSKKIAIIIGALRLEDNTPRNSTYIFNKGKLQNIANKVILVPFGESNPLPDWLGKIVNRIFYDGAVDYKASSEISRYKIDEVEYTNAICYEACSEELYKDRPKNMIVISNNGWFVSSIEPNLQKLILKFFNRKYGTIIYHSVNMSESFIIK
ncbi:Apolipoprotein N-acyltransferase [hydrothermal vent metagenome]|uniref:Apolipoprotein N-acyltransferase n=1 Tax=hydrothermal vent metagenome TaxID=652676 RepID=A0A1W1BWX1_9ZZZZ